MKNLLVVKVKHLLASFLLVICAAVAVNAQNNGCADLKEPRIPSSPRLFGLTIDSIDGIDDTVKKIKEIKKDASDQKPIVRIVFDFDEGETKEDKIKDKKFHFEEADFVAKAIEYKAAIEELRPHAYIVGLLVDSSYVHKMRHDRRRTHVATERTKAYANTLKNCVDVWELGNEINGEWVGWREGKEGFKEPIVTLEQLSSARDLAAEDVMQSFVELKKIIPNSKTALTFYYNDDGTNTGWTDDKKFDPNGILTAYGSNYSMMTWARAQRPKLPDVDHVWLSYYEDDNEGVLPNQKNKNIAGLVNILIEMSNLFKTAQIGFGEIAPQCNKYGAACEKNRNCGQCKADQPLFVNNYYVELDEKIRAALNKPDSGWDKNRNYSGGYFYWYFSEDANKRTVEALKNAFNKWYKK